MHVQNLYYIGLIKLSNLFEGKGVISTKRNRGGGGGGLDGGQMDSGKGQPGGGAGFGTTG